MQTLARPRTDATGELVLRARGQFRLRRARAWTCRSPPRPRVRERGSRPVRLRRTYERKRLHPLCPRCGEPHRNHGRTEPRDQVIAPVDLATVGLVSLPELPGRGALTLSLPCAKTRSRPSWTRTSLQQLPFRPKVCTPACSGANSTATAGRVWRAGGARHATCRYFRATLGYANRRINRSDAGEWVTDSRRTVIRRRQVKVPPAGSLSIGESSLQQGLFADTSMRPGGFEPPTRGLEVRRSVH